MVELKHAKIAIIIPCYNEQDNIVQVIKELEDFRQFFPNSKFIVINDGSTDNTLDVLKTISKQIVLLNLPCNLGVGGAVQSGFCYAEDNDFDYALKFDGDGQHTIESITVLLECLAKNNIDMVIGSRFCGKQKNGFKSSFARRMGIAFFKYFIALLSGYKPTDATSGIRCYNRNAIKFLTLYYPAFDYPEPEEIILMKKNGFKIMDCPVIMRERLGGTSSINFLKSFYFMAKVAFAIFMISLRSKVQRNKGE